MSDIELTELDRLIMRGHVWGRRFKVRIPYVQGPEAGRDATLFLHRERSHRPAPQPEVVSEAVTAEGCVVISNTDETGTHIQLQGVDHE